MKNENHQFDTSIRPQDDFYNYVNKKWLDSNPIPDSETRWGSFNILRDEAWKNMQTIYKDLLDSDQKSGTIEQQARDLYYTGMNYDKFEDKHLGFINSWLEKIDALTNTEELVECIANLHQIGVNDPWVSYVDADEKDSTKHILRFRQSGLTLPNRDYYLEDNEKMQRIRAEYEKHGHKIYELFPKIDASKDVAWQRIWDTEYALALRSRSKVELRDTENNYNLLPIEDIIQKYPNLHFRIYLDRLEVPEITHASVDQPEFFDDLNNRFQDYYLPIWKTYLRWQVVMSFYGYVSENYAKSRFEFFGKILSGTKEMLPLWKRVVLVMDDALGEGVGKLYAKKHFPESSKKEVLKLVEDVRSAYQKRINNLDWMSGETKKYAIKKLNNIKVLIGYPDKWRDYTTLKIGVNSFLENVVNAEMFDTKYALNKLKEPVSRDEWFMYPQTVNAYHDPNRLVICFPAAILQSPFYSPEASISENMGGIGTVIAHEFTHGFDDQGCQFDAEGNLRTWQTKEEREAFEKKADIIINQADNHEVIPGVYLKGKLVIGESIADLGGIEIALSALKNTSSVDDNSVEDFFTSYAKTECGHTRDEKAREFALTDPHPDSKFRVNGIVQHSDDWHDTYEVEPGDKLYRTPKDRARIW